MMFQQSHASQPYGQRRTSGANSLPSYTTRIAQRMMREEAIKATVRMMTAYTGFRCSEEELLVLAEVLMQFPLETATAAASPIHGVSKQYRDYPVKAGQLTEWCEREAKHLYDRARLERGRLAAPDRELPSEEERARVQAKLQGFLAGCRPGVRFVRPAGSNDDAARREAQAVLDRYAADAQRNTEQEVAE